MSALSIRRDRTPAVLRKLAKAEPDARVARRMLAIANALCGLSREAAAMSAGMDRQTLRDWVIRYNEHGLDGLCDLWGDGRPPKLDAEERAELLRIVLTGPDPEASGLSAFTREDLVRICEKSFNGKFRDECLSLEWFRSRTEAKVVIEKWRQHFNTVRPHSSLGYLTPAQFVARGAKSSDRQATGRTAAVCGASALRPVAQPSRLGQAKAETRVAVSS